MNKRNISLYIPRLEDLWYEAKLQSDPNTMSYNAGYDVSYFGYHYDTGCIDFPKERWEEVYDKRLMWFFEGIATNLAKNNYELTDLSECNFELLMNDFKNYGKGRYKYSYTVVNYILNNYSRENI